MARILIVDDDPGLLRALRGILEDAGHEGGLSGGQDHRDVRWKLPDGGVRLGGRSCLGCGWDPRKTLGYG